jgi:hypothetical protein
VGEKEILAVSARETGHLRERGGQGIRFYLNKEVHTYVFAALQIEVKISMIQGVDEITSCPLGVGPRTVARSSRR